MGGTSVGSLVMLNHAGKEDTVLYKSKRFLQIDAMVIHFEKKRVPEIKSLRPVLIVDFVFVFLEQSLSKFYDVFCKKNRIYENE